MHGMNDNYGHAAILLSYAKVAQTVPLRGILQHGWTPLDGWTVEHKFPGLLTRFTWGKTETRRIPAGRVGGRYVQVGSPFAYLIDQLDPGAAPPIGSDVLAFPVHSVKKGDIGIHEHQRYSAELAERFGSVTVSLYHLDAKTAVADAYTGKGHRVISMSSGRESRVYLYQWLRMLEGVGTVTSQRVSTALLYASALNRNAVVCGTRPQNPGWEADQNAIDYLDWATSGTDEIEPNFAKRELGFDALLSPEDLRAALGLVGYSRVANFGWAALADIKRQFRPQEETDIGA